MEQIIQNIQNFADESHGDQKRKYSPDRYIVHPIRVMKLCSEYTNDVCILAAALLHDVLEDTKVKEDEMRKFLLTQLDEKKANRTLNLVKELTDEYTKAKYPLLNRRKRKEKEHKRIAGVSAEAQTIKYADLIDNAREIISQDADFAPKYVHEAKDILRQATRGDQRLLERAWKTIEECEAKLSI